MDSEDYDFCERKQRCRAQNSKNRKQVNTGQAFAVTEKFCAHGKFKWDVADPKCGSGYQP
jgi:hypothetical protein